MLVDRILNRALYRILIIFFLYSNIQMVRSESCLEGFVLIKGGTFKQGDVLLNKERHLARVEDFEILDHPVTNREYKFFIDATDYPAPLYWKNNTIPEGKENFPVIFIDRFDVDAYLKWISREDGRVYRLPTYAEFEYAARGGLEDAQYPWGNDDPNGRANYNEMGDRKFNRWQDYLKTARWGDPNGYGLYCMAGNVWNMCVRNQEIATYNFKFRIENIVEQERVQCGGSWYRSADYLRCGSHFLTFCVKHPDIGFRPVREPEGVDWREQARKIYALPHTNGSVFLSWALLETDHPSTAFNIYRLGGKDRHHAGFRINDTPLSNTCDYIDASPEPIDNRCQYYIRTVDKMGREGRRSEWCGVNPSAEPDRIIATFRPVHQPGYLTPVFGDLDGDGTYDCVIRLSNGNVEGSQDPGYPVQLEAFTSYGKSLWRKNVCYHEHCYGSANNNPFNIWDMDGDRKAEVITRLQIGDSIYVAILDGMNGRLKYKSPWPPMFSDTQRSSTRIQVSIAYLDGKNPAIITQTGVYQSEVLAAFDAQLNKIWQFNSFAETSGSGSHRIEVGDVDGDGRMEVFDGTTCLNNDGTLRWSIYKMHADQVSLADYIVERPGLEVFYAIESNINAGVYMVDANSGEIIWKYNKEDDPRWTHAHSGWTADIWDGSPGLECLSNRSGHRDKNLVLFSGAGKKLFEPFPYWLPVEWDGDLTKELIDREGSKLYNFDGHQLVDVPNIQPNPVPNSSVLMAADLYGDFRDELVVAQSLENGLQKIIVVADTQPVTKRYISKTENLTYRLWLARNYGGGYPTIFNLPLKTPSDNPQN